MRKLHLGSSLDSSNASVSSNLSLASQKDCAYVAKTEFFSQHLEQMAGEEEGVEGVVTCWVPCYLPVSSNNLSHLLPPQPSVSYSVFKVFSKNLIIQYLHSPWYYYFHFQMRNLWLRLDIPPVCLDRSPDTSNLSPSPVVCFPLCISLRGWGRDGRDSWSLISLTFNTYFFFEDDDNWSWFILGTLALQSK